MTQSAAIIWPMALDKDTWEYRSTHQLKEESFSQCGVVMSPMTPPKSLPITQSLLIELVRGLQMEHLEEKARVPRLT